MSHRSLLLLAGLAWACAAPPDPGGPSGTPAPPPSGASLVPRALAGAPPTDIVGAMLAPAVRPAVEVEAPEDGAVVGDAARVRLTGRTLVPFGALRRTDVAVVIDTSGSTARPSGADVDGDGVVAQGRVGGARDPGDSVLAAEVASARVLMKGMDPERTRLAVVAFSGWAPRSRNDDGRSARARSRLSARTVAPLTSDRAALEAAFDRILADGADGMTDLAGALDRAVAELSRGAEGAEKVVVFLTDGTPTLPHWADPARNERVVVKAADRARAAGVRVYSFAIGPRALERPAAAVAMAHRTGGVFTPVRDPRHLTVAVEAVRFDDFQSFAVRNVTTGRGPERLRVGADGAWEAWLPLAPGRNRLRVRAVVGGQEAVAERTVHYAPAAAEPFVPPDATRRGTRLGDREVDVEAARILEGIERDRREIERALRRPGKELDLDVAAPHPDGPGPVSPGGGP